MARTRVDRWQGDTKARRGVAIGTALALPLLVTASTARAVPTATLMTGEVERITLDNPLDPWSGGVIVMGGTNVIVPRNLLVDLPANRLRLQAIFAEAPAECVATGESGLAKGDACNASKTGGIATIHANRQDTGDVIAADVFLAKGIETVAGVVTYIDHAEGWFRLNGAPGSPTAGVMVRLNDPDARHTVQTGLGCVAGAPNCSPDPRFTLDADNYTNVLTTGYPWCLPSTQPRTFNDDLDFDNNPGTASLVAQANADGTGDVLCPTINAPLTGGIAGDSRRFAPLRLGDHIVAEGNFETINGVRFVSAHSSTISRALLTSRGPNQPDYLFLAEVEMDAAGFENQRARTLFIGFSTDPAADVMAWSLHYDPVTNQGHEFPLASTLGCDAAAGAQTCVFAPNMWKIRHDVDFVRQPPADAKLSPCAHLRADPRFAALNVCPLGGSPAEEFAVLAPTPHEIQTRTGRKYADLQQTGGAALRTKDVSGNEATNGQYLFPFGLGLGGISFPEFGEIDLNLFAKPFIFEGLVWNLDRRLGPSGCLETGCDTGGPIPLDPFPYSGLDPRTQSLVFGGPWADPVYSATPLSNVANRIVSYVDGVLGTFNGNATLLNPAMPAPAARGVVDTPPLPLLCPAVADTVAPGVPTGVAAAAAGPTQIDVTWTAATDNVAVLGYEVYRDGGTTPVGLAIGSSYADTGLAPGTTHTYTVLAFDAAGNKSTQSAPPASATTASLPAPAISAFNPTSGLPGTQVFIAGQGLAGATAVRFGTLATLTFSSLSDTLVSATVPAGAVTGAIAVDVPAGTLTSASSFTVLTAPPPGPVVAAITGFTPATGPVGTSVTISGAGFTGTTAVIFGTTAATVFAVSSDTQIVATVPAGATTGEIFLGTPNAFVGSLSAFTVTVPPPPPAPALSGFSPASGPVGTSVVLAGTGFTGATAVVFNATTATSFSVVGDTQIVAVVPAGATTGRISVAVPTAFLVSATDFTVTTAEPPPPPAPLPPPGPQTFADSFNTCGTNISPSWNVTGTWTCAGGFARGTTAGGTALVAAPQPADQTVSCRVQHASTNANASGVIARAAGGSYYVAKMLNTARVQVVRHTPAGDTVLADLPAPSFQSGIVFNRLTLQVGGSSVVQLRVTLNGTVLGTVLDSGPGALLSGQPGLYSGSSSRTQYDSFTVQSP